MRMPRLYYGWVVLAACFLVSASYGIYYSFGVFFTSIETEFGWSAALVSSIVVAHHAGYFLSNLFIGWLTDKTGPRVPILIAAFTVGTGITLLSLANHIFMFLGLIFYASLGATVCWTLAISIAQRWFVKNSGTVTGIVAAGTGTGIFLYSSISGILITVFGWRMSFTCLGVATGLLILLCSFLIVTPEQKRTGAPAPPGTGGGAGASGNSKGEYGKAIRSRAFAHLAVCQMSVALCMFIVSTHLVRYIELYGVEKTIAANVWSLAGIMTIFGGLIFPFLAERTVGWKKMMAITATVTAATFIWLAQAHVLWMFYIFGAVYGLFFGGTATLIPLVVRQAFGMRLLTGVLGTSMAVSSIGAIIGPVLAGYIVDASGSYTLAFIIAAAFMVASGLSVLTIKTRQNSLTG